VGEAEKMEARSERDEAAGAVGDSGRREEVPKRLISWANGMTEIQRAKRRTIRV
jgi:hypothetical protein